MQQNSSDVKLLFPREVNWEIWKRCKPDVPFSRPVVEFLNALSVSLLKDPGVRAFSDVVTFAFFCRKANILRLGERYQCPDLRLGRGIIFHVAPSNVPINFGYSLVAGLLGGNYNVVRVSSKEFPQVDLIISHIHGLFQNEDWQNVGERIALVRYDRASDATMFFSSFCNVRVIWGGDQTIAQIRKSPIPARSFDVTFADRYSIAVFRADELLKITDLSKLAEGFYNDTYLFDQNACSAPHLIIWVGCEDDVQKAKENFWSKMHAVVKDKYQFQSIMAVDKLVAFYRQAVGMKIEKEESVDNTLIRVNLKELSSGIDEYRCVGGYFSEYTSPSLDEIARIIDNKYQTLAYYGFEKETLQRFVVDNHLTGIDRVVPVGSTTDFSLVWDGYDLINTLSRVCSIVE